MRGNEDAAGAAGWEIEMPGGDGTGPMGMGPMTGRGAGCCAGYGVPGFAGAGRPGGLGCGRGHRNWFRATGTPGFIRYFQGRIPPSAPVQDSAWEIRMLEAQAQLLQEQHDRIRARLEELGTEAAGEAKARKD